MEQHLNKVNAAKKAHDNQSVQISENKNKSDVSSSLYIGSSDIGNTLVDSAYSSLGPINEHLYAQCRVGHQNASSKVSGASGYKPQAPGNTDSEASKTVQQDGQCYT